eukprot:8258899-Alexandrium_andersonii.AAC.1
MLPTCAGKCIEAWRLAHERCRSQTPTGVVAKLQEAILRAGLYRAEIFELGRLEWGKRVAGRLRRAIPRTTSAH